MRSQRPTDRLVPDAHLRAIGAIAVIWALIEVNLETMILALYDVTVDRGLVLTANIPFTSRISLLRILANGGAVKDQRHKETLLGLLTECEEASGLRNDVVYAMWGGGDEPGYARRVIRRARGKNFRFTIEQLSLHDVEEIMLKLDNLRLRFATLSLEIGVPAFSPTQP